MGVRLSVARASAARGASRAACAYSSVAGSALHQHRLARRMHATHSVLGVFAKKVSLITYLGPHTLSYEGLC